MTWLNFFLNSALTYTPHSEKGSVRLSNILLNKTTLFCNSVGGAGDKTLTTEMEHFSCA